MRRKGGYVPIYTAARSQGGSVKNFDFFACVINEWSVAQKACKKYEIQKQAPGLQLC